MTQQTTFARDAFFNFWRRRLGNLELFLGQKLELVRALDPEVHILATAGLDALSNHWAATFCTPLNAQGARAAERMHQFLLHFGDQAVFQKISAPDLLYRAGSEHPAIVQDVRALMKNHSYGIVRYWEDDPDTTTVLSNSILVANLEGSLQAARRVAVKKDLDPRTLNEHARFWLEDSRYAAILYRHFRCSWVHEFSATNRVSSAYENEAGPPRYQNYIEAPQMRIVFPLPFLLGVYRNVIEGFASACAAAAIDPVRP